MCGYRGGSERKAGESGARPVGIDAGAHGSNQVYACLVPRTGTRGAARGILRANRGDAGIALRVEIRARGANAMRALRTIDGTGCAIAQRGSPIAADLVPSRRTAMGFGSADRGNARAASIGQWAAQSADIVSATRTRAARRVRDNCAAIVPGLGATIRPRSTTKRTNGCRTTIAAR
jgi:hypothetical protein